MTTVITTVMTLLLAMTMLITITMVMSKPTTITTI